MSLEDTVWCLSREVLLKEKTATNSSIFASIIPWTEEPGGATVYGVAKGQI